MSKWYLNDLELTDAIVTARKIDTPWVGTTQLIHGNKALVNNPNRLAQPITVDISLRGSTRFAMESSIRAELEACPSVYLESTEDYIYGTDKACWFMPSGMNITDGGAKNPLKCTLAGLIDERTIHHCNSLTNWVGTSLAASTTTRYGTNSIKDTAILYEFNLTTYTPTYAIDISRANYINFWFRASKPASSFDSLWFEVLTNTNYSGWDLTLASANTWQFQEFEIASPDHTSGAITETNITSVRLRAQPATADSYDVYLSWIFME